MTTPADLIGDINNTLESEFPKLGISLPINRIEAIDVNLSEIQGYLDDPLNNVSDNSNHKQYFDLLSSYQKLIKDFHEKDSKILSGIRYVFERSLGYLRLLDPNLDLNDEKAVNKAHEDNPSASPGMGVVSMRVGLSMLNNYIDITESARLTIAENAIIAEDTSDALNRYMNSPTVNEFTMIQRFQKGIEILEGNKKVRLSDDIMKPLESFNFDDYWD